MPDQQAGTTDMPLFADAPTNALLPQTRQQASRHRGYAGFSWGRITIGIVAICAAGWGAWVTREVMALREKRIVSVSLAAMANDFVMAEARAGNSLEQTEADTRHYMSALRSVLKDRAGRGDIILVGEAVVSDSVPDMTPDVRAAVGKLITANPPPRVGAPPSLAPTGQPNMPSPATPGFPAPAPPATVGAMGAADGSAGN